MIEIDTRKTISGLPAPNYWHIADRSPSLLIWQRLQGGPLQVFESIKTDDQGRRWLHVSVSRAPKRQLPSYDDLQLVRRLFVGEERECYMIFPPKDRYVDINPVLHLWTCLDQPDGVLPRFENVVTIDGKEIVDL